jgi:hypothetical protein
LSPPPPPPPLWQVRRAAHVPGYAIGALALAVACSLVLARCC